MSESVSFEENYFKEPLENVPAAVQSLGDPGEAVEHTAFEHIHYPEGWVDVAIIKTFTRQLITQRSHRTGSGRQALRDEAFDTMLNHARTLSKDYPDSSPEITRRVRMWHLAYAPTVKVGDVLEDLDSIN